jgi:hypothetical protein
MSTAARNRAIKNVLEKAFGPGKIWVRGGKGTSYGWVYLYVDVEVSSVKWRELRTEIMNLLKAAKIDIDTYGYDDPGSDYGYGSKIHINFTKPYDVAKKEKAKISNLDEPQKYAPGEIIGGYSRS